MLYALQAQQLQPVVHHQQLLVQLLRHLLAGSGLSACWEEAERQQKISRLSLQHPLGCPWLNRLDLVPPHLLAQAPVPLSLQLAFISNVHRLSCSGVLSLSCGCQPYLRQSERCILASDQTSCVTKILSLRLS